MLELVEYIVKNLVDNKDKVVVTLDGEIIKISVDKSDMGKVIGKQGRISKAIKTIVKSAAVKQKVNCSVEIVDV